MEELSLDNILSEDQVNGLFSNEETQDTSEESPPEDTGSPENEPKEKEDITTEETPETLFGNPESVGSNEDTQVKEDTPSHKGNISSNFYSSIANALAEDGILQNLSEEDLNSIVTAEDFAEAISDSIKSQLDYRQQRIDEALQYGVEPSEIQKYERYISILDNISEERLTAEDEEGENIRKNLIFQDCINRGFSQEKAMKMVERSISSGTDIDDAREALQDNKTFYNEQYNAMLRDAKEAEEYRIREIQEQSDKFRTSILTEEKAFGEIPLDKGTRQKVYDAICKPVYVDPESGLRLTAIQKYEAENRIDFLKNVGLLYVLTDGFKNIDNLVKDKVKKETKRSIRDLERTLTTTGSIRGGELSLANNSGNDPESFFKNWKLSI